MLGDEPHTPYERPALSKDALTEGATATTTCGCGRTRSGSRAASSSCPGAASTQLDLDARVATAGDRRVRFTHLVLATGLRARRLAAIPDGAGVHSLRSLADAVALRRELAAGGPPAS